MKLLAAVIAIIFVGWAATAAEQSRHEALGAVVVTKVERIEVIVEVESSVETPYADSLIDWDEINRQDDCLWTFLRDSELEITFEMVWAAGVLTDALGGACRVIGEDDE
jgi:hypothetical protein